MQETERVRFRKSLHRPRGVAAGAGGCFGSGCIGVSHAIWGKTMTRDEILAILSEFKQECAEKYGILEIGVFGSVARNESSEESDVDICIKTETPSPFVLVHIKEELEGRVHRHVDIIRVRSKMNPFLKERIEKDGCYV